MNEREHDRRHVPSIYTNIMAAYHLHQINPLMAFTQFISSVFFPYPFSALLPYLCLSISASLHLSFSTRTFTAAYSAARYISRDPAGSNTENTLHILFLSVSLLPQLYRPDITGIIFAQRVFAAVARSKNSRWCSRILPTPLECSFAGQI